MGVNVADYGPVLILTGEHAGQVGYYDDESDDPGKALVYLGEPFTSNYILIPHAELEKVDVKSIHLERWKRAYPWLVEYLDLP